MSPTEEELQIWVDIYASEIEWYQKERKKVESRLVHHTEKHRYFSKELEKIRASKKER